MTDITRSAGGVVVNANGEVLLVQEYGLYWGLPRGHIEADETAMETAVREIAEETGLQDVTLVRELGSYERYRFQKDGTENYSELKRMTFFLFTTSTYVLRPQDKNITAAEWVSPRGVADRFIHPKDIAFYEHHLDEVLKVAEEFKLQK